MEVPCYICEKPVDLDRLVSHLRSHSDAETRIAHQKVITDRKNANAKRPVYKRRPYRRVEGNRKVAEPVGEVLHEMPPSVEEEPGDQPE